MTDTEQIAYLAGIFDGEGCIGPSFRKDGYMGLFVKVSMSSPDIIQMFHDRWPGTKGIRQPAKPGYKTLYAWSLQGTSALPFLRDFVRFAVGKKRQAELAIVLAEDFGRVKNSGYTRSKPTLTKDIRARRAAIGREIQSLNHAQVAA